MNNKSKDNLLNRKLFEKYRLTGNILGIHNLTIDLLSRENFR